jgi:hypothetical protein
MVLAVLEFWIEMSMQNVVEFWMDMSMVFRGFSVIFAGDKFF